MFVPDRGADFLYVYQVYSSGDVRQIDNITLPLGTGGRHVTFRVQDRNTTMMYLVSELDNTIRVFQLDGVDNDRNGSTKVTCSSSSSSATSNLSITLLQVASTLGPGSNRTGPVNKHLASEMAITNDGRFLYAANRITFTPDSDDLAIFALQQPPYGNSSSGAAEPRTYLGQNLTYGKIPRHFSVSNDEGNAYVSVANEVSNTIMVFRRNAETGFLEDGGPVGNLTLDGFDESLLKGPMAVVWG
jgi:6-phosphogluconolactonase